LSCRLGRSNAYCVGLDKGLSSVQVELRQLRYFVAVAEELHFRRAAERLMLTQPALSHQIARLERQLGVRLLERDRRSVALTPAGEMLLEGARGALCHIDQTIAATRWASGITTHALRLGYPTYAGRAVTWILHAFRERHSELWVDEHRLQSHGIRKALHDHTLDAGFVNLPPSDGLSSVPIVPDHLTIVLPAAHALARRERIPLAQLAGESLLMVDAKRAPTYHALITACCQQAGFVPQRVGLDSRETWTMEALAGAVADGRGLLLLPDTVNAPQLPEIAYRPADLPHQTLRLNLAWRAEDSSPVVRALADLVRDTSPIVLEPQRARAGSVRASGGR
jgi:DNA-binding transcriptional LysR family regulator